MRNLVPTASITLMLAGAASADLTVDLGDNAMEGGQGFYYDIGSVTGTLTAMSISFDFVDSGWSYAADLALIINNDLLFGGDVDNLFPMQREVGGWGWDEEGDGHYEDTIQNYFAISEGSWTLLLGNDYESSNVSNWNNVMVTFHGVNGVPAPGAIALLGMAGLVSRRRRA